MTRRQELIVQMLRSWDLTDTATGNGQPGSGDHVPLQTHERHCLMRKSVHSYRGSIRCTCWLRSMRELERCLRLMRAGGEHGLHTPEGKRTRRLWYHTYERYIAAHRRPMTIMIKHGRPVHAGNVELIGLVDKQALNKHGNGQIRVLVETWSARADQRRADEGVIWLSEQFRGEPQLPVDLAQHAA